MTDDTQPIEPAVVDAQDTVVTPAEVVAVEPSDVVQAEVAVPVPGEEAAPVVVEATEPVVEAVVPPVEPVPHKASGRFSFARRGPGGGRGGPGGGRRPGQHRGQGDVPAESDYEEKNIEIARVTRVTKGGKRMRFRALTVIGNRKGRVGFGLAKGLDVAAATGKATAKARKSLMTVPLVNETVPHAVIAKFAASRVLLKPAPKGTGIKAGGAVRIVLELAGVPNVVSKILGSGNKINNVKATMLALRKMKLRAASDVEPSIQE